MGTAFTWCTDNGIHADNLLNSLKIEIKSLLKKRKKIPTKSPRARWIQDRILPGIQRKALKLLLTSYDGEDVK